MNKKRTLVIILLTILALGVLGVFYFRRPGPAHDGGANFPSKPTFPNYVKGALSVNSTISKENFNFPDKLPLVLVEPAPALTQEAVLQTADRAGFPNKDFIVAEDVKRGKVYIFKGGSASFTVYARENEILFVSGKEPESSTSPVPERTLISTAESFLKDNLLSEGEGAFYSSINYLLENGEGIAPVEKNLANIIKVNFSPIESEIKFVETNPLDSTLSVWLDPFGQVIKAEAKRVSSTHFSPEQVTIKSYEEFNAALKNSVLVSLANGNLFPGDLNEGAITEISVTEVEIAYYQGDSSANFYQPVFLLKGTARIKGLEPLPAVLYLPAANAF